MINRALTLLLVFGSPAYADSWIPPSKQVYSSSDGSARVTVTPRALENSLAYFKDKVAGREPAGVPPGATASTATAMLERRSTSGRWQEVWTKPLVNEIAPVEVVISNGGVGLATFDNWHSMGHGPNAIVIYRADGSLVSQLSLGELFPDWFVAALPHSVSSIHWRGEPRISGDGSELIVPIVQPTIEGFSTGEGKKIDLAIRMADGVLMGLERPEWKRALKEAAATASQRCALGRKAIAEWNAPISAPKTSKEQDWHHFLRETQYRTKWSGDPPSPSTTVLRLQSARNFNASVKWLEEALTETAVMEGDLRAIASPDIARLTVEIERIGRKIRQGQLKEVDLVIVADVRHADRIRSALGRSGATLTIIDPAQSFPQIKQRIQDEAELVVCRAPESSSINASGWLALPFLAIGGGLFLLRRS